MDRQGLLEAVSVIAKGRMIPTEMVFQAVEEALVKALRLRLGEGATIEVVVVRSSGEIKAACLKRVVEVVEDPVTEIALADAIQLDEQAVLGGSLKEMIPGVTFSRNIIHLVKQSIVNKVREAEQERQLAEYKDQVGEVVRGIVKRFEGGNVILDLGHAEGVIPRQELIKHESLRYNERVRGYIYKIQQDKYLPPIFISRRHPQFVAKLFEQEVPEIENGIIKIVAVARDPGSRTKIVVSTEDSSINPVGTCVGVRGSRVNAVISELNGEKIDIVNDSGDKVQLILNVLAPATVQKVILEEDQDKILVVVPETSVSLAIGPGGQNVRLAAQLVGKEIEILTEKGETDYQQKELDKYTTTFCDALDVDEVIGKVLYLEGFRSLQEIIDTSNEELEKIQGFSADLAAEIKDRAQQSAKSALELLDEELAELKVEKDLLAVPDMSKQMAITLGKAGVRTRDELADLDLWELTDSKEGLLRDFKLSKQQAEKIIMYAREPWFEKGSTASEASEAENTSSTEN